MIKTAPSRLLSRRNRLSILNSSSRHTHNLSTSLRWPRVRVSPRNGALSPAVQKLNRSDRSISTISTVLLPPVVFAGLIVTLWTWKCFMMVLFQNKIIYMPFLPPNARSDTIAEYSSQCDGIKWKEEHITSGDGTDIALAVAEVGSQKEDAVEKVVLYFQGENSLNVLLLFLIRVKAFSTRSHPASLSSFHAHSSQVMRPQCLPVFQIYRKYYVWLSRTMLHIESNSYVFPIGAIGSQAAGHQNLECTAMLRLPYNTLYVNTPPPYVLSKSSYGVNLLVVHSPAT